MPSVDTIRSLDPWYRDPAAEIRNSCWTEAPRGQTTRYEHPVCGDDALTSERSLPVTVVAGVDEGPVLLLLAGEHGDEYENIFALQETLNGLDPAALKGRVVGVTCCSIDSYLHRDRVARADGHNLARCYPGNAEGTLTERIAYTLQNDFLGQSGGDKPAFMLALHTYGPRRLGATLSGYNINPGTPDLTETQRRACLAAGFPLVWATNSTRTVPRRRRWETMPADAPHSTPRILPRSPRFIGKRPGVWAAKRSTSEG